MIYIMSNEEVIGCASMIIMFSIIFVLSLMTCFELLKYKCFASCYNCLFITAVISLCVSLLVILLLVFETIKCNITTETIAYIQDYFH